MDRTVFLAVLGAAALHAGWNALVKVGLDRLSTIVLLALVQGALALALAPLFAAPDPASWPWIAVSALLHTGYKLFLIRAYLHGDLSLVYPLARGSAPLIVAIVGALALGEVMSVERTLAVVLIAAGVITMSLRGGDGVGIPPAKAVAYALGTAAFTAGYTLVDGVGARLSNSASGFTLWMFVGDGLGMLAFALIARGPQTLRRLAPQWRSGLGAGAMSLAAYWIAIWAFTQAPLALVAALRETSVLFAMVLGVVFLGERAGPWRWLAAALIGSGVMLVHA